MIVFVDDERFILEMYRQKLKNMDHPYYLCSSVAEAKAIIDDPSKGIRLVITDLHMSGENGYDLVHWLHENHPKIRKVVLSAHSHEQHIHEDFKPYHLEALIKKPIDIEEELVPIIEIILRNSED